MLVTLSRHIQKKRLAAKKAAAHPVSTVSRGTASCTAQPDVQPGVQQGVQPAVKSIVQPFQLPGANPPQNKKLWARAAADHIFKLFVYMSF